MNAATKTLFATLAIAAAAAAIAAPAAAQPYDRRDDGRYEQSGRYDDNRRYDDDRRWDDNRRWDNDHHGDDVYNINARQAQIDQRIEWGARRGRLDRHEVVSLRIESRDVARLETQYRPGGLTPAERRGIDRQLDRLEARLNHELRDRNYGYGYGNDRYRR